MFLERIRASDHPAHAPLFERILDWSRKEGLSVKGGTGAKIAGLNLVLEKAGRSIVPFYLYEGYRSGVLYVQLYTLRDEIADENILQELDKRLSSFGLNTSSDSQYPGLLLFAPNMEKEAALVCSFIRGKRPTG